MSNAIVPANSSQDTLNYDELVKTMGNHFGVLNFKPKTLSKAKAVMTFKTIFETVYEYQFVVDNGLEIYANTNADAYVANVPTNVLPDDQKYYFQYLCTMLGVPVPNFALQLFFDEFYAFKFGIVPKIVKYFDDELQDYNIGIKLGIDADNSNAFIVPIDYVEEIVPNSKTPLRYNVNGNKLLLRYIPIDEKLQKTYGKEAYFEVALIDKNRYVNFSFKIDINLDHPDISEPEDVLELWNQGDIVPYVNSSSNLIGSLTTIFSNLFRSATWPTSGVYFGVEKGTREGSQWGTCWDVVIPPELMDLEVVINKAGDLGKFGDISKMYFTDKSPLSKYAPETGFNTDKFVVCVYKANTANPTKFTPIHTVVKNSQAVAPIMRDSAEDFITFYMTGKSEVKALAEAKDIINPKFPAVPTHTPVEVVKDEDVKEHIEFIGSLMTDVEISEF